ncbi:MAG: hypothetical protein E6I87_06515 [Chloroflexi bacterium]|nr:MAG: hypothetical protein E6I87_06515 [Chloroflexota bacterium]
MQPVLARGFQYGLGIFTLTALIGLANATKLFGQLDQNTLLTHLHSGTLGWITMGVVTVAAWLFGTTSPRLAASLGLTALATAAYVLAFWSGYFPARAAFGAIELVVIVAWWWWVASRSLSEGLGKISNPKVAILLGLTTLVIGSTIGVIIQIQFATNTVTQQTGDLIGTHASAQIGGYLILVATGIVEWLLIGERRTTGGVVQSSLLFVAGLALAGGFLAGIQPLLLVANVVQIVATIVVVVRLGSAMMATKWVAAGARRFAAIVPLYLVIGVALVVALVQQLVASGGDQSKISQGLLHSVDHTFFIGVMTNTLFAAILLATKDRPQVWPWADHVVFWGLNLGVLSFTAVLVFVGTSSGASAFSHPVSFTAPIMGLSVLLGIATFLQRLQPQRQTMRAAAPA